ncbi:MAG: class II glutamine amidotransferase [Elusimicrobia bacterium]|nr:class II glutamine amidotransferase [Elusimicrobiota bacterium]
MCGIIGISNHRNAAQLAYTGLFALQHRGQEAAGLVTVHQGKLKIHVGMGLVSQVFKPDAFQHLPGRSAIGHVRYATTGESSVKNAQPLLFTQSRGSLAIAHNGNLTNAQELKQKLEKRGAMFQSSTDSEVIVHLIARNTRPLEDAIIESLRQVEGAYSLLFLSSQKMIAVRDPHGFRPLVLGRLNGSYVVASETCALDLIKSKFVREIEPGEMVIIEGGYLKSLKPFAEIPKAHCIFEYVYFARPDSKLFGTNVHQVRRELGRELAREMIPPPGGSVRTINSQAPLGASLGGGMKGIKADLVVPVPDSGVPAALGFSQESGIMFEMGFIRSHYTGRTFIQPLQSLRDMGVELKLSALKEVLQGKRIILVDDSIVRGTTSRKIIRMLRRIKVKEIHMAISSPPIVSPCYYGIDTPQESELIAANHSIDKIRHYLGVDSLHYLSLKGLLRAASAGREMGFCTACFTREYPTRVSPVLKEPGSFMTDDPKGEIKAIFSKKVAATF